MQKNVKKRKMRKILKYSVYLFFFIIIACQSCSENNDKAIGVNSVYDYGFFFTKEQNDSIENFLTGIINNGFMVPVVETNRNYEQVNVDSLSETTFMRLFNETADNGCLIFLSISTREVRVRLGKDISKNLNDSNVQKVVDFKMLPYFKQNRFYDGIVSGVTEIEKIISEN